MTTKDTGENPRGPRTRRGGRAYAAFSAFAAFAALSARSAFGALPALSASCAAAAAAVALWSCSVEPIDLADKSCPCAAGWTCNVATNRCLLEGGAPADTSAVDGSVTATDAGRDARALVDAGPGCQVQRTGKLKCTNRAPTDVYAGPDPATATIDMLRTSYSTFDCWVYGVEHRGKNRTWYRAQGDDYGRYGFVPAFQLDTPDEFDPDPTLYGLSPCGREEPRR